MAAAKSPAPEPLVPQIIHELVARFTEHRDSYRRDYNETQLRRDFLDPFFKALGWDVDNEQGYAEAYRDVIHEDALRVERTVKAPDYCFRIGGVRKYFVEAKKPSVDVKLSTQSAFQLRRYAWTAKLPLSILTDFEEFAVYDCRVKPDQNDKAATARVMFLTYDEYVARWPDISGIFSREAILKGSFDKYAESNKKKRGTAEVDDAFLAEIETWREALARNISLRNQSITDRELNFAVQAAIDRIIFLRMCEGRDIEEYGRLSTLTSGTAVYPRLIEMFHRADEKYNSGLFHFQKEKGREPPDELTTALAVDDKVLKDILRRLYYPESPYEFAALPADILGQVYEQFLGKVIVRGGRARVRVEDKPEVKKAGGVYYTPTYIVDYIVENTVGKLLDGKTPQQVGGLTATFKPAKNARPLTVLDPACGSGSFLIVAYQYLLDWYLQQYTTDGPEKHARGRSPRVYRNGKGEWRLTGSERKRILLSHIYGVDIDFQAVEVTKLSLLLKVLEGETEQSLERQRRLFHKERALPDLANNIKCGNSLIGPEFYDQQQMALFEEEERLRINVFDWRAEFRHVFRGDNAGFDALIGNPPYIRVQAMTDNYPHEVDFYKRRYLAGGKGNFDIYVLFIERGLSLLRGSGKLGLILPHKFFNSDYGGPIRAMLAEGKHLQHLVHFGHQQVFSGATTYTCLLFLGQEPSPKVEVVLVDDLPGWIADRAGVNGEIDSRSLSANNWYFSVGPSAKLIEHLRDWPTKLGDVADVFVGLQTSADDVYILALEEELATTYRVHSNALGSVEEIEKALMFPLVSGTDVRGYAPLQKRQLILFPYRVENEKATLLEFGEIESKWPRAAAYLLRNKERLAGRERGKFKGNSWYRFGRSQNLGIQSRKKLCVPRLVDELHASFDSTGAFFLDNVDVGGVTWKSKATGYEYEYLLGLLNSRLLRWFFPAVSAPFRGGWRSANRQFLSLLPFPDLGSRDRVNLHDRIVSLAKQLLHLHQRLAAVRTDQDRKPLQRQIDATKRQIDQLVYKLYQLTDAEVAVVE